MHNDFWATFTPLSTLDFSTSTSSTFHFVSLFFLLFKGDAFLSIAPFSVAKHISSNYKF